MRECHVRSYTPAQCGVGPRPSRGCCPTKRNCLRRIARRSDASFLVLGSGNGRETFGIYDAGFHNMRGVDITPGFVELAQRRSRELQLGIDFILASADQLPFAANSFSVVTMSEICIRISRPGP